jgi:hypothetical protein
MASFLATLSAAAASNWEICKRHQMWGTGTSKTAQRAARNVRVGDELFVWRGGAGLIARASIVTAGRPVTSVSEVPWPDPQRYSFIFGIDVEEELLRPGADRFKDHRSVKFGIRTHELQAGLIQVSDEVASAMRSEFERPGLPPTSKPEVVRPPESTTSEQPADIPQRDRRWARPMAGVYLRPASTVTEALLALYRRVADDDDGELMVIGDERDRDLVERELKMEPFNEIRDRVRFVTGEELAAELQRRFPRM